jgi:hypothetical protein
VLNSGNVGRGAVAERGAGDGISTAATSATP